LSGCIVALQQATDPAEKLESGPDHLQWLVERVFVHLAVDSEGRRFGEARG
jgi:hypothetical protein